MKVRISALILAGIGLFAVPARLFSWEGAFFDFLEVSPSARAAAMGGLHAALADDATTLFSNPAGLRSVERQVTVSACTLSVYESAADYLFESLPGVGGSSAASNGYFNLWGPLAFSYVRKGRGFGIFSSSNIFMSTWGPIPAAREMIEVDLVIIMGRAFRIPLPARWQSTLDVGLSLVAFTSATGSTDTDFRQVLQSSASVMELLGNSTSARSALGAGIEFGLLYSFREWVAFGIAGRNLSLEQIRSFGSIQDLIDGGSSTSKYNALPLDLSAGILFRPPLGRLGWLLGDLVITADYHNMFDFAIYPDGATNPLLHIGVGLELKLLEIVSLRAGYYQCLPSVGIGLDFSKFTFDFAYFGRELSKEPGGYPVDSYSIGVDFKY